MEDTNIKPALSDTCQFKYIQKQKIQTRRENLHQILMFYLPVTLNNTLPMKDEEQVSTDDNAASARGKCLQQTPRDLHDLFTPAALSAVANPP